MRRRLAMIITAALLGSALLLPLTALPAAAGAQSAVVLATEGVESDAGLEPKSPDATENEFAPADYEPNWTWRAGKVLLGAFVIVGVLLGLLYYVRVARPRADDRRS